MPFAWRTLRAPSAVSRADVKELKDNTDHTITDLQATPFSWQVLANMASVRIPSVAQVAELRQAIDYAKDMNYCRTHDSTKYDAVQATYNTTVELTRNTTVLSTKNATVNSSKDASVDTGDDGSVHGSYDANVR